MGAMEDEGPFLERIHEYLVSLPFDLKILQEAMTDPDLSRAAQEIAVGTIIHTLLPQEGEAGPARYIDDVLWARAALARVVAEGGEGAPAFKERFSEVYGRLDEDLRIFSSCLGDLWPWLESKLEGFPKLPYKGKKPQHYLDDEEAASFLYEEGLEFQTNYNLTEQQVQNKLRRMEQVFEFLNKRRSEEARKRL